MNSFKKNIYRTASEDIILCPDCIAHNIDIGIRRWTGCNANTEFYRNGDPIPEVSDPIAWAALTTGAWCHYNNDPLNDAIYGKLYNWHAVNDPRGLAPIGYSVPSDTEWTALTTFLGGTSIAGGAMKEEGLCHWNSPNVDATDTSLFTGLPGGYRDDTGIYSAIGGNGFWWSSTDFLAIYAWNRYLYNLNGIVNRANYNKENGFSVRFIQDLP